MVETRVAVRMDFPRIRRLPPYVFNVVGDLCVHGVRKALGDAVVPALVARAPRASAG